MEINVPSGEFQMRGGNKRIAAIVPFAGEDETAAGSWKKLPNDSSDACARFVHKRFGGNAAREGSFFRRAHFRRTNDG